MRVRDGYATRLHLIPSARCAATSVAPWMFWPAPARAPFGGTMDDPSRRRDLYEIVLAECNLDDIRNLISGSELVRPWVQMYLPPWARTAWQPLIDSARTTT